jgi:hypothetical protein
MSVVKSQFYIPTYNYHSREVYVTTNEEFLKLKSICAANSCELAPISRAYRKVYYEIFARTRKSVEACRSSYFRYLKR